MNVNISSTTLRNWLAEAGSIAAIILGAIPATGLPASVRGTLIAAGGAVQAVSHYFNKKSVTPPTPSTPTPAAKPATTVPPPSA